MGLLDDAIRDHIDLKRRHGSDPTEIARIEREALGPVRRGPEPFEAPYHRRPTCDPGDIRVRATTSVTQPTEEFDVVAADREELVGAAVGTDVLGGTPDFLQQTPAHDRLWFEQKPPQEFDF